MYKEVFKGGVGEIVEKKSRFIASVFPVSTEEEAIDIINQLKKKYWDARHNCYAYVCGHNDDVVRFSDDGEPAQTAGKPMLDILMSENVKNILVVVTRYFGGVLLGTGGLVRAYQQATKEGLKNSTVLEMEDSYVLEITTDYTDVGKIKYICASYDAKEVNCEYGQYAVTTVVVSANNKPAFVDKLTQATSARAKVDEKERGFYHAYGTDIIKSRG